MIKQRNNFHVITGCSGGGKSTIIKALRVRGFHCVDEAGRQIVREQLQIGGDGVPWQNQEKFRELLLSRYMFVFEQTRESIRPVFFDRAIPEIVGFSRVSSTPTPPHISAAAQIYRYAPKVFMVPPWKEIFRNDDERRHSFEDGVREYDLLLQIYPECGYELVEVPKAPVAERIDFILCHIRSQNS
jgi:predicted ATPase